jgi:hypothetical protein
MKRRNFIKALGTPLVAGFVVGSGNATIAKTGPAHQVVTNLLASSSLRITVYNAVRTVSCWVDVPRTAKMWEVKNGRVRNLEDISFPMWTNPESVELSEFSVGDATNVLFFGTLDRPVRLERDTIFRFNPGALTVSF